MPSGYGMLVTRQIDEVMEVSVPQTRDFDGKRGTNCREEVARRVEPPLERKLQRRDKCDVDYLYPFKQYITVIRHIMYFSRRSMRKE